MNSDIIESIIERAKAVKSEMCLDNCGPADAPPILLGEIEDGIGFLLPDEEDGHPTDNLVLLLGRVAKGLLEKQGSMRWSWLAYVVEGYGKEAEDGEDLYPEDYERGSFETEYKTNPSTTVREGIIVYWFPWDGTPVSGTTFYRYDDHGQPTYDETALLEMPEAQGNIPELFADFREFCEKGLPEG
jgi:hypothetical protein